MGMNDDAILNNISKEEWDRGYTNIPSMSKKEWIESEKKRISDFFHEQSLKEREMQQSDLEKLMKENHESRVKQVLDFVWAHVPPEQLEREMNQRYRDAGTNTRISIEVHRQ